MRSIHVFAALAFLGVGCAASPREHDATTMSAEPTATIDAIVERWYDNARVHPDCRVRQNRIYTPEGRQSVGEQDFFARLRSPVVLAFSHPEHLQERIDSDSDGHGNVEPYEYHTLYSFERGRILYAKDSDYARILPTSFQLSESAEASRIPSDFINSDRSYLLFANFIEFEPRLDALVVCELSNPATLPSILGQLTQ